MRACAKIDMFESSLALHVFFVGIGCEATQVDSNRCKSMQIEKCAQTLQTHKANHDIVKSFGGAHLKST